MRTPSTSRLPSWSFSNLFWMPYMTITYLLYVSMVSIKWKFKNCSLFFACSLTHRWARNEPVNDPSIAESLTHWTQKFPLNYFHSIISTQLFPFQLFPFNYFHWSISIQVFPLNYFHFNYLLSIISIQLFPFKYCHLIISMQLFPFQLFQFNYIRSIISIQLFLFKYF